MKIPINPVAKPRMTRRDVWKQRPCVVRYREFCDELRKHIQELPPRVRLVFHVEMPKSWSGAKKRRLDGQPHQQRPDVDNQIKSILDALSKEDSYVWEVHAKKLWAYSGFIEIEEIP